MAFQASETNFSNDIVIEKANANGILYVQVSYFS